MDGQVPEITPVDLKQRMDNEHPLVLVDVREPFEASIADLPECGQKRIPTGEFAMRIDDLDSDDVIVLYCRTGGRSAWATELLMRSGFEKVLNLKGGVLGWREEVDPSLSEY